jgi:phosphoglycolate phosphatase
MARGGQDADQGRTGGTVNSGSGDDRSVAGHQTDRMNPDPRIGMAADSSIRGFIFDLDGTLVDSGLDFHAMRREMSIPENCSILEEISHMETERAEYCRRILERHELDGAERAIPIPGALEFIRRLDRQGIKRALVTRNSRPMAEMTLRQCGLRFDLKITREDGPAKPDPWAIARICDVWNFDAARVVMVGDFRFDIEAGKAAGARTVFFTRGRSPESLAGIENADYLLESFDRADDLMVALGLADPDRDSPASA